MSDELERLEAAVRVFDLEAEDDFVDPGRLAAVIDRLTGKLCRVVQASRKRGDHLLDGCSAVTLVSIDCKMSRTSAADHLCVGEQLQSLPRVADALSSGQIGYQAASVICHLSEQVGEKRDHIDEDYENRYLHLSEMGRMYKLDALLDPEGGAALKMAIESLSTPRGRTDDRSSKQRRADAFVELVHHAMDAGTMPRRNSVRPHININTTLEGLKGELGAAASELQGGMAISSKTVQRLACDGTLSRILKADSVRRRRRPSDSSGLAGAVASPQGQAPHLRRAGLRPAGQPHESASPRVLGSRGSE